MVPKIRSRKWNGKEVAIIERLGKENYWEGMKSNKKKKKELVDFTRWRCCTKEHYTNKHTFCGSPLSRKMFLQNWKILHIKQAWSQLSISGSKGRSWGGFNFQLVFQKAGVGRFRLSKFQFEKQQKGAALGWELIPKEYIIEYSPCIFWARQPRFPNIVKELRCWWNKSSRNSRFILVEGNFPTRNKIFASMDAKELRIGMWHHIFSHWRTTLVKSNADNFGWNPADLSPLVRTLNFCVLLLTDSYFKGANDVPIFR